MSRKATLMRVLRAIWAGERRNVVACWYALRSAYAAYRKRGDG